MLFSETFKDTNTLYYLHNTHQGFQTNGTITIALRDQHKVHFKLFYTMFIAYKISATKLMKYMIT